MLALREMEHDLGKAMAADRHRLGRDLRAIAAAQRAGKPFDRRLERLAEELRRSIARCEARRQALPAIRFPDELPICAKREEIAAAIRDHQVVIVCGETGSGKSTQLPKICLEMGRGVAATIGHTQPRRIAARSIAARIAEELASPLGQAVGYKHRFTEVVSPLSYIKLMTDGILLAETQHDRFLNQYDTLILDEAHERSLNIDFLMGYLKQLLPRRPDLKLIITSATIDAERFSRHFELPGRPAPVVEVSGRSYPVEIRYRPIEADAETGESDWQQAVLDAVDELARLERGDLLIFLPSERDIHELAKLLRAKKLPGGGETGASEILPLYARLPAVEQQRVFQTGPGRRIVIATNVAESSLTVPGVRYVIDTGTARISRYSPRSKTQRLPIEPVSQASADQRAGRCGRVGPGVCLRLYSAEDYESRDRYTPPEILRTNLAAVILQIKALRLGDIEGFPFLDPPRPDAVRAGFNTLHELGALDERDELTEVGRQLGRLPVDPRIGRMILAGQAEGCLHEILVIASALAVQDPRERPLEKQEEADRCHAAFVHPESDFLSYLKLWEFYHQLRLSVSRNQLRKACRQNFLSHNRLREWADIHRQLLELVGRAGLNLHQPARPTPQPRRHRAPRRPPPRGASREEQYGAIHRALLTGLLSNLALRSENYEYTVAGGAKFHLWPGSGTLAKKPRWIVAAELVETTKRYLRCCARIDRGWIEPLAEHLVRRTFSDLRWDRAAASAVATERVTLYGLPVVPQRRVEYGAVDHATGRDYLIQYGLIDGELDLRADFIQHNRELLDELKQLQVRLRRNDLLAGPLARFEFYDQALPHDVYDGRQLMRWLRVVSREDRRRLFMTKANLLLDPQAAPPEQAFPDVIVLEHAQLPLAYRFDPEAPDDGLSLSVPVEALGQLEPERMDWLVPGLLEPKIVALIKSLPKDLRRRLIPAPDTARKVLAGLRFGQGSLLAAVASQLSKVAGETIPIAAFALDKLTPELRMNIRVVGPQGELLTQGRDLLTLRRELNVQAAQAVAASDDMPWTRDNIVQWDLDEFPAEITIRRGTATFPAFPMLVDRGPSVSLRLASSLEKAVDQSRRGLRRLFHLAHRRAIRMQVDWLPDLEKMLISAATLPGIDLRHELAELLACRATLLDEQPLPRTRADYELWFALSAARIPVAAQDVAEVAPPILAAAHRVQLALEHATAPNWRDIVDDARGQLLTLLTPGFLPQTPWTWLAHLPRFLRAIVSRLEKLTAGSLDRDRMNLDQEIRPRWLAYQERRRLHQQLDLVDPALEQFRWHLEEYRVSLFAQELGTSIPISGKRLDRVWETVQS